MGKRTVSVLAGAAVLVLGLATPAAAMSGGRPVLDDRVAPWEAVLAIPGDPSMLQQRATCGGVLVGTDRVLTAAHCVNLGDPSRTEVHIGARVLSQNRGTVRG